MPNLLSSIPKKDVWIKYCGYNANSLCFCCGRGIGLKYFNCGIVNNNIVISIDNLRPICSTCKKEMRNMDMSNFIILKGYNIRNFGSNTCNNFNKKDHMDVESEDAMDVEESDSDHMKEE